MNDERTRISVILPVRDGDVALLRRAVDSVRSQSEGAWELLIADDGSAEAMAGELDATARADERIRVLHRKAAGVSAARNHAIREARGEVITFLDCDDCFASDCLKDALELLEDPSVDGLFGGTCFLDAVAMERLDPNGQTGARSDLRRQCIELAPERLHTTRAECVGEPYRFGSRGGYINRGIAARFIRKRALEKEDLFFPERFRMYEDTIWNLRMMEKLSLLYVPKIWYYYFDNRHSASNRFHADAVERIERPLLEIREMLDLTDETEYAAYTRFLMDSLRYVFLGLYGNEQWRAGSGERRKIRDHLYGEDPWREIGTARFRAHAEARDRKKALLYRWHLLFHVWGMRKRTGAGKTL